MKKKLLSLTFLLTTCMLLLSAAAEYPLSAIRLILLWHDGGDWVKKEMVEGSDQGVAYSGVIVSSAGRVGERFHAGGTKLQNAFLCGAEDAGSDCRSIAGELSIETAMKVCENYCKVGGEFTVSGGRFSVAIGGSGNSPPFSLLYGINELEYRGLWGNKSEHCQGRLALNLFEPG